MYNICTIYVKAHGGSIYNQRVDHRSLFLSEIWVFYVARGWLSQYTAHPFIAWCDLLPTLCPVNIELLARKQNVPLSKWLVSPGLELEPTTYRAQNPPFHSEKSCLTWSYRIFLWIINNDLESITLPPFQFPPPLIPLQFLISHPFSFHFLCAVKFGVNPCKQWQWR